VEIEEKGQNDFENRKINSSKLLCYLNLAACNLKLRNSKDAIDACNEALKLEPNNVKALYRKARAELMSCGQDKEKYMSGLKNLENAMKLDPSNEHIKNEYNEALKLFNSLENEEIKQKPGQNNSQNSGNQSNIDEIPKFDTLPYQSEENLSSEIPEILALNEYFYSFSNPSKVL